MFDFQAHVPRDPKLNLEWRRLVYNSCIGNPSLQAGMVEACRRDVLFWINTFVWQYNPNPLEGSEIGPFITWGFQDEAILELQDCIKNRVDALIEKSREMGASWLTLLLFDHQFLFFPLKKFLLISRSEEAVDKTEEPDCLFWKLDFVHEHLPEWMVGNIVRRRRTMKHKANRSFINGQASTGKAGVGGRCTAMLIDEFSQITEDREVRHRTSDTTGCRFFNGTHLGLDTSFYDLSQTQDDGERYLKKIMLHWSQHPHKVKGLYRYVAEENKVEVLDKQFQYPVDFAFDKTGMPVGGPFPGLRSPWYDNQCKRKGDSRAVAMDLDINPSGSVSQFFDAILIQQLKGRCKPPYWEGELEYDRDLGIPQELVPKKGGRLKIWIQHMPNDRPPWASYGIGADVSQGVGATNSCASVMNRKTGAKVAEWSDPHTEPDDFGRFLVALARLFCDKDEHNRERGALIAWEIPGSGQTAGKVIYEDLHYPYIFFRKPAKNEKRKVTIPGWPSTAQSKLLLLNEYHKALRRGQCENLSEEALSECLKFKYTGSTVEHPEEEGGDNPSGARSLHGDKVIADAIAWMLCAATWLEARKKEVPETPVMSLQWRRDYHRRQRELASKW